MSKLLDGLFPKTQRIDAIMAYNRQADKTGPDTVVNLMDDPDYVRAPFVIRRAMFFRKNFETWRLRMVPGQLMGGSTMACIPMYITDSLEERRKYGAYNMNLGMLRAIYGDTPRQAQNVKLLEDFLRPELHNGWCWCHSCIGLERILHKGYLGMAEEAQAQMDAMNRSGQIDQQKLDFWQAVIIGCEAISDFSMRYSREYLRLAEEETDSQRREELRIIAGNMAQVPGRPARTFHEALQSAWFAYRCQMPFYPADLGRFDQLVYPYYKRDVEQGLITPRLWPGAAGLLLGGAGRGADRASHLVRLVPQHHAVRRQRRRQGRHQRADLHVPQRDSPCGRARAQAEHPPQRPDP